MRLVTVNSHIEQIVDKRLRKQKAYSAANSMMLQLQIPQGDQLVYLLGYPNVSNNKDAICQWILDQDISALVTNESYVALRSRLRDILCEQSGGYVE